MTATLRFLPWMRRGLARSLTGAGTVEAAVTVDGEVVTQELRLRGPGDVIGVAGSQIARIEPASGTGDFEPNYFAAIELVTPDLPWMFTPAAPANDQLVPWLVLVVVADVAGVTLETRAGTTVLAIGAPADAGAQLPDLAESWAWAHVQAATEISASRPAGTAYAEEPEAFLARLICPRRLDARTTYHACLVPAFESGVRAGFGLDVDPDSVRPAWDSTTRTVELPVYHSWRFTTGVDGDFESLVRRLTPRELDAGVRDLDIGHPGTDRLPRAPGTLVSYEGALMSPAATRRRWPTVHRERFEPAMLALVNQSLAGDPAADPAPYDPLRDDPVVAPPAYGALPAGRDAVPPPPDGRLPSRVSMPRWLSELNLDPVRRVAAGLGAAVVRRDQEALMASAWAQATGLRDINRLLNWTRLAGEVGASIVTRKIAPLDDGAVLQLAGTARGRIAGSGGTVAGQLAAATVPSGVTSPAFRRITRRGGTVGRGLATAADRPIAARVASRFTTDLANAMAYAAYVRPSGTQLGDRSLVGGMPGVPADFSGDRASRTPISRPARTVQPSSELAQIARAVRAGLDPVATLGAKLKARITAPAAAWSASPSPLPASMSADPSFPDPLYEAMRRLDPEYLLPGVGAIPEDTVGLTEANGEFVEAFLLGANHELAREFLWREYPADLSDTWLRTFWDAIAAGVEDIERVATWAGTPLGSHQKGAAADGTLALIIKGALLRRYPDTMIYAVKATWNGEVREELAGGERRDPMFSGTLGAGVSFLGFALDRRAALGDVDADGAPIVGKDAGWFFVFEEAPVGPRFGLDVGDEADAGATPHFWKNASWGHLVEDLAALPTLIHASPAGRLTGVRRSYEQDAFWETWGKHAAAMARITLQRPVRMLVHASAMLP